MPRLIVYCSPTPRNVNPIKPKANWDVFKEVGPPKSQRLAKNAVYPVYPTCGRTYIAPIETCLGLMAHSQRSTAMEMGHCDKILCSEKGRGTWAFSTKCVWKSGVPLPSGHFDRGTGERPHFVWRCSPVQRKPMGCAKEWLQPSV